MKTKIALLLASILIAGCVTHPIANKIGRAQKSIRVETEPPGMRIYFAIASDLNEAEANKSYIGQSPCSVVVKVDSDGRFVNPISGFIHPVAVFFAEPDSTTTNLFPKSQSFKIPAAFYYAPKAPDGVFFDMRKP